ncbi:MAG: hypothetical protein FWC53_04395 [Firmicutes bacterium]|nr:hypothetical protein [Bacillota bacterium]
MNIFKILKKVFFIAFLLVLLAYVVNITSIPDNIILFKGENLNLGTIFGLYVKEKNNSPNIAAASASVDVPTVDKWAAEVSLFNIFPVKEVSINTIPNTKVIPLGNTVRS